MHDVAVALDEELVGDLDGADLGDAADIVAAEIEQHQMLGALLRIGEQFLFERLVFVRRRAARARAGDRADGHGAIAQPSPEFPGSIRRPRSCRNRENKDKGDGLVRRSAR